VDSSRISLVAISWALIIRLSSNDHAVCCAVQDAQQYAGIITGRDKALCELCATLFKRGDGYDISYI